MPICLKCGGENEDSARFCRSCGEPTSKECPACGRVDTPDAVFCTDCGARYGSAQVTTAHTETRHPRALRPVIPPPARQNRGSKVAILVAGVVIVIVLLVATILFLSRPAKFRPQAGDEWVYSMREHDGACRYT